MVALPENKVAQNGHVNKSLDTLAREYIRALRRGMSPDEDRPTFDRWESIIENIERVYERSSGDVSKLDLVIEALSSQDRALFALLNPPPTLEDIVAEDRATPDYPELPDNVKLPPALSRGACRWLDRYVPFSSEASPEGYEDFHVFCGLWALSVVAARRVYLPLKRKRIYTNLMIALCADTSMFAKSTTAQVSKDLLYASNLSFLIGPDRTSPQKLLSDMAGKRIPADYAQLSTEKQARVRLRLAMSGQRGLFFDEFGKFVQGMLRKGSTNADFAELFLTLDSCPGEYENTTLARGGEPIQKPYLPLLGSMTYSNLKENSKSGADFWTDGFWARFSFIAAPPDQYKDAPLDAEDLLIPPDLVRALEEWHERLGVPECWLEPVCNKAGEPTGDYTINRQDLPEIACSIAPEAHAAWKHYRSALKKMLIDFRHKDFHGSYTRLPETALRMAVIMASLENDNRIEIRHWAKAQELAEQLRKNLHELYRQVNQAGYISEIAKAEDEVLSKMQHLAGRGIKSITVAQMKGCYLKSHALKDLREVMDGLVRVGLLKKEHTAHAQSGKYSLVESEVEREGTNG